MLKFDAKKNWQKNDSEKDPDKIKNSIIYLQM